MKDHPDLYRKPTSVSDDTQVKSVFQLATESKPQFPNAHKIFMENNGFSLEDEGVYNLDVEGGKRTKLMLSLQNRLIVAHLPENGLPTCEQMKTFYDVAQDTLSGHQLPITKYDDLKIRKSVIPRKFHGEDTIKVRAIGNIIMSFIATKIPSENKILQLILQPHHLRNDSYGALYSLIYLTTPWLCPERLGWLHRKFDDKMHPFEMAAIIIQSMLDAFQQNNTGYSTREQALEMLTQVMHNSTIYAKQKTELIAELKTNDILLPGQDLNEKFRIINLAILLSDQSNPSTTSTTPIVNTVITQNNTKKRILQDHINEGTKQINNVSVVNKVVIVFQ